MKITVVGTGYVGLVTGACFAETGNDVICCDIDAEKIRQLDGGEIPFYEPGLPDLVSRNVREGRLIFSSDPKRSIGGAEISFVCVGTPSNDDGSANLSAVFAVADMVAEAAGKNTVLAVKSTVPIGTCDQVRERLNEKGRADLQVVSNPEFLREGSAVQDCMLPDRVVVGTEDDTIASRFRDLYGSYVRTGHPIIIMDLRSAEMTKYAANSFLAARISFMNEMASLSEKVGANIGHVREAIGADHRIGPQYLFPSVGFGGSCFPKDVRALIAVAREHGAEPTLLEGTLAVNEAQKRRFVERIFAHFGGEDSIRGKTLAVWGLAFKAKTDDIRESPALTVIDALLEAGALVKVYDPVAIPNVRAQYGSRLAYAKSTYEALEQADALCVLTEWNQFRHPDFERIKKSLKAPVIFDGRNLYDPEHLREAGFTYYSIGRP